MKIKGIFDAKSMPENVMQKAVNIMSNGYQNEVRIMYYFIKIRKKGTVGRLQKLEIARICQKGAFVWTGWPKGSTIHAREGAWSRAGVSKGVGSTPFAFEAD